MVEPSFARRIEQMVRTYFQACNDGDAAAVAACFCPDAVHYFAGIPRWSGAAVIGDNFARRVRELGQCWSVDQLLVDGERGAATVEWTQFDRSSRVVRGVDWIVFEPNTARIREVRPYLAVAPDRDRARQELRDFDYAGRGYPMNARSG